MQLCHAPGRFAVVTRVAGVLARRLVVRLFA
jgi:hypothetical protein